MPRKSGAMEAAGPGPGRQGAGTQAVPPTSWAGGAPCITSRSRRRSTEAVEKAARGVGVAGGGLGWRCCRESALRPHTESAGQSWTNLSHITVTAVAPGCRPDASPLTRACRDTCQASPDRSGRRWAGCPSQIGVPVALTPESFFPSHPLLRRLVFERALDRPFRRTIQSVKCMLCRGPFPEM